MFDTIELIKQAPIIMYAWFFAIYLTVMVVGLFAAVGIEKVRKQLPILGDLENDIGIVLNKVDKSDYWIITLKLRTCGKHVQYDLKKHNNDPHIFNGMKFIVVYDPSAEDYSYCDSIVFLPFTECNSNEPTRSN